MQTKICFACREEKEVPQKFNRDKYKPDGFCSYCKACQRAKKKEQYRNCGGRARERSAEWRTANPEWAKAQIKEWQVKNMEKVAAGTAKWRAKNPHKVSLYASSRRALKLKRTPGWLTEADLSRIAELYAEARKISAETGTPHHVDHILPLVGRLVSGLHVPANLQILTGSENSRKSNTWSPE